MSVPIEPIAVTTELCEAFSAAADDLARRRVGNIPAEAIDSFIRLDWMEWHGGMPRLTTLGRMALAQVRTRMTQALAEA